MSTHWKQHEAAPTAARSYTIGLANVGSTIASTAGSISSITLNGRSAGPSKHLFTLVDGARQAAMFLGVAPRVRPPPKPCGAWAPICVVWLRR
jgi:hypothetical protein